MRRESRAGRRGRVLAGVLLLGAALHARGTDTGELPLHRIHTGDLGMLVAVEVRAAGRPTRWLLDTGASRHLVSPAFAARHALVPQSRVRADTPFGALEGPQVELPTLSVGALTLYGQRALVLELDQVAGPAAEGIDGVLGAPWLEGLALDLDLRNWTMRARAAEDADCPAGQVEVALRLERGLPVAAWQVDGGPSENALLDTGNAGSLVRIEGAVAPPRAGVAVPGVPAVAARAATVSLGPLIRHDVPVTHLRAPALRNALAADVGALAGMALLEGSRLRFEPARRLCVEPGERRLPGGFGLSIAFDADGPFVSSVYDGSPAAAAGLREGDRVRRWADAPPPDSIDAAWAAVHGRDELTLAVQRGPALRAFTLHRAWFLPALEPR